LLVYLLQRMRRPSVQNTRTWIGLL